MPAGCLAEEEDRLHVQVELAIPGLFRIFQRIAPDRAGAVSADQDIKPSQRLERPLNGALGACRCAQVRFDGDSSPAGGGDLRDGLF